MGVLLMVAGAAGEDSSPRFGPYQIQELLGQGGMGVVHRAYDTVNRRVIALKRLPASVTDQNFLARFRRESRIVANLRHPNVIPVNDFGEIDGQLYLDMMLVEGTDLRRAIGKGTVTQERAIAILTQVAAALDVAHEQGLVHRDVKPSNILLTKDDHAYLADFGIARTTAPDATELTRSGDVVGSWDYMAPERLSGGQVDGRSDQYSLACVLFECLTGRLPHPAVDPAAKVAAHLLQPPPAPSVFVPTVSQVLDEAVLRGMAKDPARRYASAGDLMAAAGPAIDAEVTVKAARTTLAGPLKERDQAKLIRAIVRSTEGRKPPTLRIPHDYPPTCPYPGLRGFDRDDAMWFHGRTQVVTELLVRMAEQLDRGEPVVLVGASGAGKSSIVHAGLLPTLAGEEKAWPQLVITPGADPIGHLATAVAAHTGGNPAELAKTIREHPDRFGSLANRVAKGEPVRPVIVVDQFEELFTHPVAETDRIAFATALVNAAPALTLLAVRADLVERCIGLVALMPALTAPVLLGPMSDTQLREAIVQPARDASLEVEPSLVERLITDLGMRGESGYDPGALPRLAHALRETWNHRDGATLTLAAYRRAGGIDGAVSRTAEEIYNRLDPAGRDALRATMLRLVAVLDDGAVARRRVDPRELTAHQVTLDQLIVARLVTVDATGTRLAHEALLTAWPRLHDWIDEDRAGLIQHRRFADAVRAWADSGRHDDDLYRGVRLTTLNGWLQSARDRIRLHPVEQEFLARSNAAEHAAATTTRRRTRRLRTLVAALSVLLVVASVAVLIALISRQEAQEQRAAADEAGKLSVSRQLAAESALSLGIDPRRGALLALGAWRAGQTVEARSALLASAIDAYRGRMTTNHDGAVTGVAISGDGSVAATGGRDGTLRLWDVPQRRELAKLDDGGGWFRTVSMSTDGRLLVAANVDRKTVKLWSVPERKVLFTLTDAIDATIAPDGKTFAATTARGIVVLDTDRFAERAVFPIGVTLRLAFSPDAALLVTTDDKNVVVYRVGDGAKVATLIGHGGQVTSVIFNRTGSLLASTSDDETVRLWETTGWTAARTLTAAEGALNAAVFSPSGRLLVAAGTGKALTAWDPETGSPLGLYVTGRGNFGVAITADGHTMLSTGADGVVTEWAVDRYGIGYEDAAVLGVAFEPDGDLVALSAGGGTVQLWDRTTGAEVRRLTGLTGDVADVAFSPDGDRVVAVSGDGRVMSWEAASGRQLASFTRDGTFLSNVAFSPDGKTIAVAGHTPIGANTDRDEILLLGSTDLAVVARRPTRQEPRNGPADSTDFNYPSAVAFSPDGRVLAAPLSGGKIILWNLVDPGAASTVLAGHSSQAIDAAFSPDGELLATGGDDRRVRLWRVRDGSQIGEFGHDATVRSVAFSPDGKTLATASVDSLVRLWEVPSGTPIARLDRHADEVNEVAFDPTGGVLASAGADGRVILWQLDTERAARLLCDALDRVTMVNEWLSLGLDRGAPPICPS